MKKRQSSIEDQLYTAGICVLFAAVPALLLYRYLSAHVPFFGIPCLLHTLTGYYCPGCGGTRAVYALLRLQIVRSFICHPLVPYGAAVYMWFMASHTIERASRGRIRIGMPYHPSWLWAALVILALNVLVKDGALFFFGIDLLALYA